MTSSTRRSFLKKSVIAGIGIGAAVGLGRLGAVSSAFSSSAIPSGSHNPPSNAREALRRLIEGNGRFAAGKPIHPDQSPERRKELVYGQHPWAAILGCIDSRVPPEIIFDVGLGEIFVSRSAGQVLDKAVLGSLEFAVEEHAKLLMVLGHEHCGAVKATIAAIENHTMPPGQIAYLVNQIKPAVRSVRDKPGNLLANSIRANVELEIKRAKHSPIISEAFSSGELHIVGANYDLGSGIVEIIQPPQ